MPAYQYGQLPYPVADVNPRFNYGVSPTHYQGYGQIGCQSSQIGEPTTAACPYLDAQYNPMFDLNNHYNRAMTSQMPVGAPTLAPLRIEERDIQAYAQNFRQQQPIDRQQSESQIKEEKAVGGVSAKLDYEMDQMTDFVAEMTIGIIKPTSAVTPSFRKWVLQVLNATRLPSATILLSLSYLTLRVRNLYAAGRFSPQERSPYQMLTIALILGSKFLDDNTFQNKSWAEVSNIAVAELNREERDWLGAFSHRLHHATDAPDGFASWEEKWKTFRARGVSASVAVTDASLARQRSLRQNTTPVNFQQQGFGLSGLPLLPYPVDMGDVNYNSSSYSPYSGWTGYNSSPSTAPHTGPNTPDFYATQNGWGTFDQYSTRHSQSGFPSLPQPKSNLYAQNMAYPTSHYNSPSTTMWNCHSAACQCSGCRAQAQFHQPRYGQILVG